MSFCIECTHEEPPSGAIMDNGATIPEGSNEKKRYILTKYSPKVYAPSPSVAIVVEYGGILVVG
jgi:hypothetical protein